VGKPTTSLMGGGGYREHTIPDLQMKLKTDTNGGAGRLPQKKIGGEIKKRGVKNIGGRLGGSHVKDHQGTSIGLRIPNGVAGLSVTGA